MSDIQRYDNKVQNFVKRVEDADDSLHKGSMVFLTYKESKDHLKTIEAKGKEIENLKAEIDRLKDALETEKNFSSGNLQMYKIAKSMLSDNKVKRLYEKLGANGCY